MGEIDQPKIIEIDASDIEKVVRRVIDSDSQINAYTTNEKNILIETVYDALKMGDDRLSELLKIENISEDIGFNQTKHLAESQH